MIPYLVKSKFGRNYSLSDVSLDQDMEGLKNIIPKKIPTANVMVKQMFSS